MAVLPRVLGARTTDRRHLELRAPRPRGIFGCALTVAWQGARAEPLRRVRRGGDARPHVAQVADVRTRRAAALGGRDGHRPAEVITDVLHEALSRGDTGYPAGKRSAGGVRRVRRRSVGLVGGPGTGAGGGRRAHRSHRGAAADHRPGDPVIITPPVWKPFELIIEHAGRSDRSGAAVRRGTARPLHAGGGLRPQHVARWPGGAAALQPAQPDRRRPHAGRARAGGRNWPSGTACGWWSTRCTAR